MVGDVMAKRNGRTATAATVATVRVPANGIPRNADELVAVARTVTPDTFTATLGRVNANHGVTLAGRNVGRFSGMRVTAFQNHTLRANADWKLDDVQLAFMWRAEYPMAVGRVFIGSVSDGVSIVRGVRSDYNRTGHGDPAGKPATASESYGARRFDFGPVVAATRTAPSPTASGVAPATGKRASKPAATPAPAPAAKSARRAATR